MQVVRVEEFGLLEFMLKVEEQLKQGYKISTDNDKYPQNFGGFYSAGLVEEVIAEVKTTDEQPVVTEPVRKQRKTKE